MYITNISGGRTVGLFLPALTWLVGDKERCLVERDVAGEDWERRWLEDVQTESDVGGPEKGEDERPRCSRVDRCHPLVVEFPF